MTDRPRAKSRLARRLLLPLLLAPLPAVSQTAPPQTASPQTASPQTSVVPALTATAPAAPAVDTKSIWTIQDENASISSSNLTDRYYVNGFRIGWTGGVGVMPDALDRLGQTLWGDGQRRISFGLSQQIYTPADTAANIPPPNDRPYAGTLLGTFSEMQDTDNRRTTVGLTLGMLGPAAGAKTIQDWFHHVIGQDTNNGWDTQLQNEPVFEFFSEGVWRLNMGHLGPLETQALPGLTIAAGTLRVYAQTGVTIRIGQGLDSDFGVARVRPGLTGGDAFVPTRPFGWYVFAGLDGQAVAHDVLVEGNTWLPSNGAQREPYIGEAQFGLAILAFGTRLTYTQVLQTAEIRHQRGGLHQFGSLALSVRF